MYINEEIYINIVIEVRKIMVKIEANMYKIGKLFVIISVDFAIYFFFLIKQNYLYNRSIHIICLFLLILNNY
jgi:hypothetical protein